VVLPRFLRTALAKLLRSLPVKGRWRIAAPLSRLFPVERAAIQLPSVGRITLDLSIEMQAHVYWAGVGRDDARIIRLLRAALPPDGVFLDVGANVGIHTLAAARHVAAGGGAVLAFEPHPANYRALVLNVAQNRLRHVAAENLGLADRPDVLTGAAPAEGGNWSLASRGDHRFEVRLVRLDDYLADHPLPRLDMIKIDIEGAEVRALRGARRTIERYRPLIVFEACPAWLRQMQTSADELFGELHGLGCTIHPLPRRGLALGPALDANDLAALAPGAWVNLVAVPRPTYPAAPAAARVRLAAR
jgi:FkbM family methyltransferase